jgi:hypothetical protein
VHRSGRCALLAASPSAFLYGWNESNADAVDVRGSDSGS